MFTPYCSKQLVVKCDYVLQVQTLSCCNSLNNKYFFLQLPEHWVKIYSNQKAITYISPSNMKTSVETRPPKLPNLLQFSPPSIPDILWAYLPELRVVLRYTYF